MKLHRFLGGFFLLFFGFQAAAQHKIELQIQGLADQEIRWGIYYGSIRSVTDTLKLKEGKTFIEGKNMLPKGLYFVETAQGSFEVLVAAQNFEVSVSAPDFVNTMETNSVQCRGFNHLQRKIMQNQRAYLVLNDSLQAAQGKNRTQFEATRRKIDTLNQEINDFQAAMAKQYGGTFLGKLIGLMTRPKLPEDAPKDAQGHIRYDFKRTFYRTHFFENIDYQEPALLMTPVYQARLDEYIDQLTFRHPDSVKVAVDELIAKSESSPAYYRYTLTALISKFETLRQSWSNIIFDYLAKKYFLSGKAKWMDEKLAFVLNAKVSTYPPKNKIGDPAPALPLHNAEGDTLHLKDLKAKYTVLYFYDPNCSYCKTQTPLLKSAYARLKNRDVMVLAVNIGNEPARWKTYIQDNIPDFTNAMVEDEKVGTLLRDYHIVSTPTVYVLDAQKNIAANYLKAAEVEYFLQQQLAAQQK